MSSCLESLKINNLFARFLAIALVAISTAVASEDLALVEHQVSDYRIIHASDAPNSVRLAARELQEFLHKSTGVLLPLRIEPSVGVGSGFISLGETDRALGAGLVFDNLKPDGYRIVTVGKNLFIGGRDTASTQRNATGGTSNGTLNGVYTFLERHVGVRWLLPGEVGESYPRRKRLLVPGLNTVEEPSFPNRRLAHIRNADPLVKEWLRRHKQGFSVQLNHYHNFRNLIPPERYERHPEWFPMVGTTRPPPAGTYKLETTNPRLVSEVASRVADRMRRSPTEFSYSISPSDGGNWSESPQTKALHDLTPAGELSRSRLVLKFYMDVAQRLLPRHPDKRVCGYLYADYIFPPSVGIPPLPGNLCLVVAADFSYGYELHNSETRRTLEFVLESWTKASNTVAYYDFPVSYLRPTYGAPTPPSTAILEYLYPLLLKNSVLGVYMYGVSNWGQGAATNYLLAKLNWDARADIAFVKRDFFLRAYGDDAGSAIEAMYELIERAIRNRKSAAPGSGNRLTAPEIGAIYSPIWDKICDLLLAAVALRKAPTEQQRLGLLVDNLQRFESYMIQLKLLKEGRRRLSQISLAGIPNGAIYRPENPTENLPEKIFRSASRRLFGHAAIRAVGVAQSYQLRGKSRTLLYSAKGGEAAVVLDMRKMAGEIPQYALRSLSSTLR